MLNFRGPHRNTDKPAKRPATTNFIQPCEDERRLARELELVLGDKFRSGRLGDTEVSTQFAYDPDAPDTFDWREAEWVSEDDALDATDRGSRDQSRVWLRRAQSEKRWADTSHAVQRFVLVVGLAAFVILTMWPGLS